MIMSISSLKKFACVFLCEHLHSYTHTQILLRLSCNRCLSQRLKTVQMSASCSSSLEGEKHRADCWARMDYLRDYYSEEKHIETFCTLLQSSPCPSVPISSLKVVSSSCLFIGVIYLKTVACIIGFHCLLNCGGRTKKWLFNLAKWTLTSCVCVFFQVSCA